MKRLVPIILASMLTFASCGQKQGASESVSEAVPEGSTAVSQKSESYEDALKECFNASFSKNGGQVFYSYMFPDEYVDDMKAKNEYNDIINGFNENQAKRPDLTDGVYEFGKIETANEINEKQRNAVKTYFAAKCDERGLGLTEDYFTVGEGYEVTYSIIENGEETGTDLALAVEINDQGWKIIPSD